MKRNFKTIVIVAAAVLIVGITLFIANIIGKGVNSKFLGKNAEQRSTTQNTTTIENTQINANMQQSPNQSSQNSPNADKTDKKNTDSTKNKSKDIKVRAVYLTGISAGNTATINHIIDLCKTTELNAVVIDVKEDGKVNYASEVPEVKNIGASQKIYNPESVIKTLHDNNIYVIGRIVCFRDNELASKRADLGVKRPNGQLWREGKTAWTNPYNEEVWKYNIDIAKEAIDKGFDEIQFDYVRFPTARKTDVDYGVNPPPKSDAITKFLETAKKELHDGKGVPVSADVFGIICESPGDSEGIGQDLDKVGKDIDYICPMVYPSHYANASKGTMGNGVGQSINGVMFTAPDLEPYKVVYNTLMRAKSRISKNTPYNAKVRPYLQDFTASYIPKGYYQTYGAEQVKQQIKAVYDAGYDEWILWDAANTYSEGAFEKKNP